MAAEEAIRTVQSVLHAKLCSYVARKIKVSDAVENAGYYGRAISKGARLLRG